MTEKETINWSKVRLGDHIEILAGFAFKSARFTDDPNDAVLIKGENIGQGKVLWEISKRWPTSEVEQYSRFELRPNDVVLAMDRPWVPAGLKYAWIREGDPKCLLVQRVARLRGINGLDSRFLRFLIGSLQFTDYIKPIVTGVNVPHISGRQIEDFQFRLPPLKAQREISKTLSTYDDLIENNARRIKILEKMAHLLYREWFVDFRFPLHERVSFVDSTVGKIPQGWEILRIADFGQVITGKTPSKAVAEYFGKGMPFIKIPDMRGEMFCLQTTEQLTEAGAQSQTKKTLPEDAICVSCIGTAGLVTLTTQPSQTNQQINSIVPKERYDREFLYYAATGLSDKIQGYGATGATMANLSKGKFEALEVITPPRSVRADFHRITAPLFDVIRVLGRQNNNLRGTRDLLLPKLISGEIPLKDNEKFAKETM